MPTQPYHPLLQVYYFGLVNGIVSKQEITTWADSIIMAEDDPDYFFIEISTASDNNELFTALNSVGDTALTPLSARAVLGLIWHRFEAGLINTETAISLSSTLTSLDVLTWSEVSEIYEFESDFYPSQFINDEFEEERHESAIQFLSFYAPLRLDNYLEWEELYPSLEKVITEKEMQRQQRMAEWQLEREQQQVAAKQDAKGWSVISYSLGAITFFIAAIGPSLLDSEQPPSRLFIFIWLVSALYFTLFVCYHIVLAIRFALRKLFPEYF